MARSLTVQHEENVSSSGLFTGFLVFAGMWMLLNAVTWYAEMDNTPVGIESGAR